MTDEQDPLCLPMWVRAWRVGLQPQFSDAGLLALGDALADDDPRLLQGATTDPPPLQCVQDWPVTGACATAFCGWRGDGLTTVAEVEDYFGRVCFEADRKMGEPAACRWFLQWFDDTPRGEARHALLAEVRRELVLRKLWLGKEGHAEAGGPGHGTAGDPPVPRVGGSETPATPVFSADGQGGARGPDVPGLPVRAGQGTPAAACFSPEAGFPVTAGAAGMVPAERAGPLCTSAPETPAAPVLLTTPEVPLGLA